MATETPNSRGKGLRQLLSVGSKSKAIPSPGAEVRAIRFTRPNTARSMLGINIATQDKRHHDHSIHSIPSCFIQAARTRFGWRSRRSSLATDGAHTVSPQPKGKSLFTATPHQDASLVTTASYAEAATNTSPPPSPHQTTTHELQYLQAQLDYWRTRATESLRFTPRVSHRTPAASAHELETPRWVLRVT